MLSLADSAPKLKVLRGAIDRVTALQQEVHNLRQQLHKQTGGVANFLEAPALEAPPPAETKPQAHQAQEKQLVATLDQNAVFRLASLPMTVANLQGRILDCNDLFTHLVRYDRQALMASTCSVFELTHPDSLAVNFGLVANLLNARDKPHKIHNKYISSDGEVINANLTCWLANDSEGQPAYIYTVVERLPGNEPRMVCESS